MPAIQIRKLSLETYFVLRRCSTGWTRYSAPCLSNVGSFVWCRSVLKALKARALALLSGDDSCRCSLAETERKNAPGGFRAEGLEQHTRDHTHKKCQSTEPQSRYRQWGSLLSATKVKQGPRLPKTCLWQCPLVKYQHAEVFPGFISRPVPYH